MARRGSKSDAGPLLLAGAGFCYSTGNMENAECMVVMYHHVKDRKHPFSWVNGVSEKRFRAQLEKIQKRYRVIGLDDYVRYLYGEAKIPSRAAVLTFDDGLKDHYRVVFPILRKLGLPASFFPISRSVREEILTIAHKNHFLFHTFPIPELREIIQKEVSPRFRDIEKSEGHALAAQTRYRFDNQDTAALKYFVNHCLPDNIRKLVISRVFKKTFPEENEIAREFYLSEQEIKEMSGAGLEFGSHSHNHFVLSHASPRAQEQELRLSKNYVERLIKKPVATLSYPFGHVGEFNETTISIAKKLGFRAGLANIHKINKGRVDPFSIARIDAVLV